MLIVPLGLALAIFAVRAMVFQSPPDHPLRALQPTFADHPDALIEAAMHDIGNSARTGGTVSRAAQAALMRVARAAPLAPEPFLTNGTIAQIAGDDAQAEQAFLAARLREPRSAAARYFLADRFLRTNRIAAGLNETAALARLSERASQPLVPALAAYAKTPGAIPELRRFFHASPRNRDLTLATLALDPANADLILALAPALPNRQVPPPDWQPRLIRSLVETGDYSAAEQVWRTINGVQSRGLLFDPGFRNSTASPPFGWYLTSGSAGVAQASVSGGLDIIYYGREEAAFASQLVRLPPGSYRLGMQVKAPLTTGGLAWSVTCAVGARQKLMQLPLSSGRAGIVASNFTVPAADCPAQTIELHGQPVDSPDTAQATITGLDLVPAGSAP